MAVYFVDTSAIVKRYIQETGTADPATGNQLYLARITVVELTSAVARRQRSGSLSVADAAAVLAEFRLDLALEYGVIEVTTTLLGSAVLLAESHALRAYDAVQLAVAVELQAQRTASGLSPVILVSADQELNTAAAASGLQVEDPTSHP